MNNLRKLESQQERLAKAILNPEILDKEIAERSLADFIKQSWKHVEPSKYVSGWHIDAICEHLQAVNKGYIRRLIINIPPRHMKSTSVAVAWPTWTWLQEDDVLAGPGMRFLFTSYAQALSVRDSVKCRRIIESDWYQKNWGNRFSLTTDQNTKIRFENDKGGQRVATSVDGMGTGEGGDIIVIDDPHNAQEVESETQRDSVLEWWDGTMPTRLNDAKTGAFVIIMQRLHQQDLVGHILSREDGWDHLCLPAEYEPHHIYPIRSSLGFKDPRIKENELLWPEKFEREQIDELKLKLGTKAPGQLQQRPQAAGGGEFKDEWIQYYDFLSGFNTSECNVYILVDPANEKKETSDYTAMIVVALSPDNNYYILDIVYDKLNPTERINKLIFLHKKWNKLSGKPPTVGYEKYGMMTDTHYLKKAQDKLNYRFHTEELSGRMAKPDRIRRLIPLFQSRRFYLPYNIMYLNGQKKTVDLVQELIRNEMENFPAAIHDDMLDALSRICDENLFASFPELKEPVTFNIVGNSIHEQQTQTDDWMNW